MRKLLSFVFLLLLNSNAFAGSKIAASLGYFSINADVDGKTTTVSNPSAFSVSYLRSFYDHIEFKVGYSLLMADYTGSDLGYGLEVGANYYPFSFVSDEKYSDMDVTLRIYQDWRPFVGAFFAQRNFQSVKNSFAGLGLNVGTEKYYNEKMNLLGELKFSSLSGAGKSEATEMQIMIGVVFKL